MSEPELPFADAQAFDEVQLVSRYGALGEVVWRRSEVESSSASTQRLLVYTERPCDVATVQRVRRSLRLLGAAPDAQARSFGDEHEELSVSVAHATACAARLPVRTAVGKAE